MMPSNMFQDPFGQLDKVIILFLNFIFNHFQKIITFLCYFTSEMSNYAYLVSSEIYQISRKKLYYFFKKFDLKFDQL